MSQMNVQEGEISLNERNSITGSSSLHNLTGTRARFQPVRIKALLSLFENEDDDTEPRDSDDNSDTESLQALPDDEDEYDNNAVSSKDEDPPPEKSANKITENEIRLSTIESYSTNDIIEGNYKSDEFKRTDMQTSGNSNSLNFESNKMPMSMRKSIITAPFKHESRNLDDADNNKMTIFTPQATVDTVKRRIYNQSNMLSDMKLEARQESLVDFDHPTKAKEQQLYNPEMETPMKRGAVVNQTKQSQKAMETPRAKPTSDYNSQSIIETPGVIFSHWSRNNFFQTPTHNPMLLSKKDGQMSHQMQDVRLEPHRFCSSQNRAVRRPLSEAMQLNQGSSVDQNPIHLVADHQSIVKGNLLTKENCPMDKNGRGVKGSDRIAQSLQESNRQQDIGRHNLSAFSTNDEKSICRSNGKEAGKEGKDYEPILNRAGVSDIKITPRDGCENQRVVENRSEGALNLKNNSNNFGVDSQTARADPILPICNGRGIDLPSPVNCDSNHGNLQFSVASKTGDRKYGKTINVKGTDYLILGKLGQGMSGEVLRVQEVKTGELRAIKCVDLSRIEKETAQGCLEEVSMLDRLRAPCIINMFTYEIQSHLLYVVMEMGDTDLSKLLKSMSREKQLPLTMILYYWTEMLTAVKHIHDHGVIHSDLKPANFLLVRGRLKLIDFGIASTVNADMTSVVKSTSLGTLNYISPEAINDIGGNGDSPNANNQYKINFRSDVWSLGCILYSLVYGQTPFQHIRANWAKVNAITNPNQKIAFPPTESTTRRGYTTPPPFLVDVMRRCLQHDRKARPTVSQLLQIPYVGCNCPPVSSLPSIPPSILSKIKHSLEESEWRQLLEALERRKPLQ